MLTELFPDKERFGLCSQIQRASVSIVSNIAEGTSRASDKEKERFIEIAYGSLLETYCQLQIANDLNYIALEQINEIQLQIDKIANKLSALKRKLTHGHNKHYTLNTTHNYYMAKKSTKLRPIPKAKNQRYLS